MVKIQFYKILIISLLITIAGMNSIVMSSSANPQKMVDSFDWRTRHGANLPESPYYDGDSLGGGWCTPMRNQNKPQTCLSCWAHSTIATAEIMVNLYYNRHIDLNLSEQFLMACSCDETCEKPDEPCSGGLSSEAAQWIVKHGVVDEKSFPYTASNEPVCGDSVENPEEHLYFSGGIFSAKITSIDSLKRFLIHHGPLNIYIISMWHCMCLVGYTKEKATGVTKWIYKNSYGTIGSDNGYLYIETAMDDIKSADAFKGHVISKQYTDDDIRCIDMDDDGYYNLGIGPKPSTCPDNCPDEEDCDDFNYNLGPMLRDGSCKEINIGINNKSKLKPEITYNCKAHQARNLTIISFEVLKNAFAQVFIYDVKGNIKTVLNSTDENEKIRNVIWNSTDKHGVPLSKGVYLCRIVSYNGYKQNSVNFKIVITQ